MSVLTEAEKGATWLLMGNEAIARGAMEAGISFAAGYPGTPSSEIIENLANAAKARNIYVEWSVNEKVALEIASAASYGELRSLAVMKMVGMNVAADFLLHLAQYGTRGGMVLVSCDDPGFLSSTNEGDSRPYAQMMELPLLEPGDFQEAKDMTRWAFDLSEEIRNVILIRSVTRLSHASGNVVMGELPPDIQVRARFTYDGPPLDTMKGPVVNRPWAVGEFRRMQHEKLKRAVGLFEDSPFNTYTGPDRPELLLITSSACHLYSREAIHLLGASNRVGLLKLGTTWPLPPRLLEKYLGLTDKILVVEEVLPFMEENVKALAADLGRRIGIKTFFGKADGSLPRENEMNPDLVVTALSRILGIPYEDVSPAYLERAEEIAAVGAPARALTFCPGCPHRASFWSIHNVLQLDHQEGFVCGDIGCYTLGISPSGFDTIKTLHSMGSGAGLASGFGKLEVFGLTQPVFAVCGDSTFYHAVMPALVNAIHNKARFTLIVLDNGGTAMTGFQAHPGLEVNAAGERVPAIDIPTLCVAMGARVKVCDPFDLEGTQNTLLKMMEDGQGVKVVVLRQSCALSPEKRGRKMFHMAVDEHLCLGEDCGCNRLCTRIFKCPGLIWDSEKRAARIDEVICVGCGVCASICPSGAIERREVA
ncbi:MAG: indolepyruvate ferredoxin oxidoreductase subunit alpha [Deltaproteobacteria bacterium]|nr:indolepyruvate ferredoxin oxidoreductase subunit alpha [Deltaproteobacteria bacterium]